MIRFHVSPLSWDSSILTVIPVVVPVDVQVMAWIDPTYQFSPPLGEVSVNTLGADCAMRDASVVMVWFVYLLVEPVAKVTVAVTSFVAVLSQTLK